MICDGDNPRSDALCGPEAWRTNTEIECYARKEQRPTRADAFWLTLTVQSDNDDNATIGIT